ncbi:ArsR/SmtB family transcription factor [Mesobacillus foraminis]|uniref:ArsR/SmtB family transcription factor n=1 Tax=Mesobacillus foraminis TaxID=279826 RepID=UPI000EF4C59E|nr:metalloregulator ArsR/SmtB family transcription factor [Mesobacillus foraminis]
MDIDQVVKIHKALGDKTRYQILLHLGRGKSMCCTDLGSELNGIPSSTLSHHLKQLSDCGLLIREKHGTFINYSLNKDLVDKFVPEVVTVPL